MSRQIPTPAPSAHGVSPTYQQLLDQEVNPVPAALREHTQPDLGLAPLDFSRWTTREFHEREVSRLWSRVWQLACRETQLGKPGDYYVYEIAHHSILIVRTPAGTLKAFHNSCRHRGRLLKHGAGHASEFRCPYHAFTWNLDGSFQGAPCLWDFPQVDPANFGLPEVRVDTWGGWVFVNLDANAVELLAWLDVVPAHFARWEPENCYLAVHVEKVLRCNWKAGIEAFIESYHAYQTHQQLIPYTGIDNSQYDVWGDHVSRTITAMGTINPAHRTVYDEQQCLDAMIANSSRIAQTGKPEYVPDGGTARAHIAAMNCAAFSELYGNDIATWATHAEVMDSILYLIFPNYAPWGGVQPMLTYRHRPNGDDHETCLMDVYILKHLPPGAARPADATVVRLGADEPFLAAKHVLGEGIARVFDQDASNLPHVQRGMRASATGEAVLSSYQEVRIRHLHRTLDKYLAT